MLSDSPSNIVHKKIFYKFDCLVVDVNHFLHRQMSRVGLNYLATT